MINKLEKIDEFLCHIENFLHGKDGEDCTEARKLIREAISEAKNISSSSHVIGRSELLVAFLDYMKKEKLIDGVQYKSEYIVAKFEATNRQ